MNKIITPNQIKENNRKLIFDYIYKNSGVSQQDIAYNLRFSRPTVAANLEALENSGLIQKSGQIDTEFVGRKAAAYAIVPDFRVSIGVEISEEEIKMTAVNLYGEQIDCHVYDIPYENEEAYFEVVCEKILEFKGFLSITDEQLLGIGFAMQALISPDKNKVLYGEILSCTGLSIEVFTRRLPYPCSFIRDADSAAISEIWASPELKDAFYLSLGWHFGAAIISNREILTGKHGHSSTVEHIQGRSSGPLCYCGKRGCIETLCSLTALLAEDESPETFFEALRQQDLSILKRWNRFLLDLAEIINMLHMVFDTDFILGGYLSLYLCEEDISVLYDRIRQLTPFAETQDFILISKMTKNSIAAGAALLYIQAFLNELPC